VRYLFPRPPPDLRRRIGLAAVTEDVPTTEFCRRVMERWVLTGSRDPGPPAAEGPWQRIAVPVADSTHRALRILAADIDMPVGDLVVRVLDAQTPFATETLVRMIEAGNA
jgi:hypothetical protein